MPLILITMTQLDNLPPDMVHVLFDVLAALHDLLNQHLHLHLPYLKKCIIYHRFINKSEPTLQMSLFLA